MKDIEKGIEVREATERDLPALLKIDKEIWPTFRANEEAFLSRIRTFPHGQLVAIIDGNIAGSLFTQRINYSEWEDKSFTWNEITDNGTIRKTHRSNGQDLYGVGLAVAKNFQGMGIPDLLMVKIAKLVFKENLRAVYLGARMPGYHLKKTISPWEYIEKKKNNYSVDPEIRLYQSAGFSVVKLLPNYMIDQDSSDYGVLMIHRNPFGKISGLILGKIICSLNEKTLAKFLKI